MSETEITYRISNFMSRRSLALAAIDTSFNPDSYDPAFDDVNA
ncbi:MAG TPA: hypothetical protein VF597_00270 [Candidatus Saccharimonadales bacterium]|jgi:hypothetical protein